MADSNISIVAYQNPDYSSEVGKWEGNYKPDELKLDFQNEFIQSPSIGISKAPTYAGAKPQEMDFPLVFDNSYIASWNNPTVTPVKQQVEEFTDLVYSINGDSHQANFLIITSGDFIFKGQARNLKVKYSTFNLEGDPIRAFVTLTVHESIDIKAQKAEAGINSPDLTHSVVILEGESLASVSQKYYGSPHYYLELAKVNRITNFRVIRAGTRIVVPPLRK